MVSGDSDQQRNRNCSENNQDMQGDTTSELRPTKQRIGFVFVHRNRLYANRMKPSPLLRIDQGKDTSRARWVSDRQTRSAITPPIGAQGSKRRVDELSEIRDLFGDTLRAAQNELI